MKKLLENFRHFIQEAAMTDVRDLGLIVTDEGSKDKVITIYSTSDLLNNLHNEDPADIAVRGWINFGPIERAGDDPDRFVCYAPPPAKAWQVNYSTARKGFGPLTYDTALSLACTEFGAAGLMADRGEVSRTAQRIWGQWLARGRGATGISVRARQLDRPPPNNRTPPKHDDCWTHVEKDPDHPVNWIFDTDNYLSAIEWMKQNHKEAMAEVARVEDTEQSIIQAGDDLFHTLYSKYQRRDGEELEENLEQTGVFFAKNKKFKQPYIELGMQSEW